MYNAEECTRCIFNVAPISPHIDIPTNNVCSIQDIVCPISMSGKSTIFVASGICCVLQNIALWRHYRIDHGMEYVTAIKNGNGIDQCSVIRTTALCGGRPQPCVAVLVTHREWCLLPGNIYNVEPCMCVWWLSVGVNNTLMLYSLVHTDLW